MIYSIVIPAHNEAAHLEQFVGDFLQRLPEKVDRYLTEVLLVENGSNDGTLEACYRLQKRFAGRIRVLSIDRPSYGEAIKLGILSSSGTHISILECDFLDADFVSTSIDEFESGSASFVVASKSHPDSIDQRPLKRRVLTTLYNAVLRLCLGYPGSDTHGLKSIEAAWAKRLCALAVTSDEIFQTELVLLGWWLGLSIREAPIRILERRPTPISVVKRLPMVFGTVRQLRGSLDRFPKQRPLAPVPVVRTRLSGSANYSV